MVISVRENTIEEIKKRLEKINTVLNKIYYLESAIKQAGSSYETKRYIYDSLAKLYQEAGMLEKSAKILSNKSYLELTAKERVDTLITSAEIYSKIGDVELADEMFERAFKEEDPSLKAKVILARKNIFLTMANELEKKGKRRNATKFLEKLAKMELDPTEKKVIKERLRKNYAALGLYRESKMIERL